MKKVFFIILLFASVKSFSQVYSPMNFDTSCYWVNYYDVYSQGTLCSGYMVSYVEKDTSINFTTYFKISTYVTDRIINLDCFSNIDNIFPHYIFIRDDTALRQVLMYDGVNPEKVLIDFGLDSGDAFNIGNKTFVVDSTYSDSLNIYPRLQRLRFLGQTAYTFEGIGMTINFPYWGYGEWATPQYQLQCYSKNGVTLFGDSPCKKNWPLNINNTDKNNVILNFSENIFSAKNTSKPSTLSVYSLIGNIVYTEKIDNDDYSKDLSTVLPTGFYIVAVYDENNKSVLKIVIK